MTTPNKKANITIDARRWRDKPNGNTYHSVQVYVNGQLVGEEPYRYRYDRAYMQTAFKLLQDAGMFVKTGERLQSGMDKDYYDFMNYIRDNRELFHETVVDVARKSDLFSGGKTAASKDTLKTRTRNRKASSKRASRPFGMSGIK